MELFAYEWTCSQANAPASLAREGHAMLRALVADLEAVPGWRVRTLPDSQGDAGFHDLAARADATLAIAPETDGLLLERARWVAEAGGRWLGAAPDAIALTTDKPRLTTHWRRHGVPCPAEMSDYPAVLKPRDGAGSQATFLVRNRSEHDAALAEARRECPAIAFVLEPFVPGQPASVAFLIGPQATIALPPATQRLSSDGRFRYLGGQLPLPAPLAERAAHLARRAIEAVPGLAGYVGVDLVLGETAEGDAAIEINPRLTTSYLGLRALCRGNLAHALVAVALGEPAPALTWHDGPVCFQADGSLETPR